MLRLAPVSILAAVSLLWAFSFGLVGITLQGVPSPWVAALRLGIATLVILPLFRWRALPGPTAAIGLLIIGAVQFGCMYLFLFWSYRFLPSHLVALFTVFTPVYILVIHQVTIREWRLAWAGAAFLSVAGALLIRWHSGVWETGLIGFLVIQAANMCFALGQLSYRAWQRRYSFVPDRSVFALIYLGGAVVSITFAASATGIAPLSAILLKEWLVLLYLGVVASGLGFFLWNYAAARSEPAVLAVANNWVVPLGFIASLVFFGEAAAFTLEDWVRLVLGGMLVYVAFRWALAGSKKKEASVRL